MPAHFTLKITADSENLRAEFQLLNAHGSQLAYRLTDFNAISLSRRYGLFDLRNYLNLYVEQGKEQAAMDDIGVCIAEQVLGEQIFTNLWQAQNPRTLCVQLPAAADEDNPLAAMLARVPWEIAKAKADEKSLAERNLVVRAIHDTPPPATQALELTPGEDLRVLFVFAEARGSRPLAARQERRQLLNLLEKEIYPKRRVVAHFLSHGVTRERLFEQIQQNNGYHIVHWSGHGHRNLLELAKSGGAKDHLSGEKLRDLFFEAGAAPPRLMFLSACHSGDILRVQDWDDFRALAEGKEPASKAAAAKDLDMQETPGFTGTAHALLHGGVPQVVAMRYAVGDDYARELAAAFYRALLADAQAKAADAALNQARKALLSGSRFAVCDHATPVLYGGEQPVFAPTQGRSPALNPHKPRRLHDIAELTMTSHEHFVGRTWELAALGADFIGSGGSQAKPVAAVIGLGGMGKTALTAEALDLWQSRFDWLLLYQAKPNALGFEAFLHDADLKLRGELGRYYEHVKAHPADAIYRDADAGFTGPERLSRLTRNLLRALQDEAVLLVLDNFETNLKPEAEASSQPGRPRWTCQDPAWDDCLKALAEGLAGSRSRVLMTSRRPPAAVDDAALLQLGPLPAQDAALYVQTQPALRRMAFSTDLAERKLAERLLNASRFHPLLLDRLARLAASPELRPNLLQALETLEQTKDFASLPALFAVESGDAREIAYLDDALVASLEQAIAEAGPDARRLLWIIAVANEPVELELLAWVWTGEDTPRQTQLRQIKQMLDNLPQLPPELQEQLQTMPPELRAMIDELPKPPVRPELEPLLKYLLSVGLASDERAGTDGDSPLLTCHELVRERILARMQDRDEPSVNAIRLAYAECLEVVFNELQHQNMSAALAAGSRALVYCVQAQAWNRLGSFASDIVTGAGDLQLLQALIPHLQTAAESAPEGEARWRCLCYLADALESSDRPDAALPFYRQAAALARAAAETGGVASRRAWGDLASITGNWAIALRNVGDMDAAYPRQLEAAEAHKTAGKPEVHVVGSELEALRINIMQGQAGQVLPQVEAKLAQVAEWWRQYRAGQAVPEAPDGEYLARAYIGALDIAKEADYAREDWASALARLDAILEAKQALRRPAEDLAGDRFNRATVLKNLGCYGEAQAELEACLQLFQNNPVNFAKVLSSLADLFAGQGDFNQAATLQRRALALRGQLPDPSGRANSHHNLANYLERLGEIPESSRHQLADLTYCLAAGLGRDLQISLGNYAVRFRRALNAGNELAVPRVAELLADPAFDPLKQWLNQRQADTEALQAQVDEILEQVRLQALKQQP